MAKSSLNGRRANEKSSSNGQAQAQDANGSLNTSNSSSSNSDGVIRVGSGFQVRIYRGRYIRLIFLLGPSSSMGSNWTSRTNRGRVAYHWRQWCMLSMVPAKGQGGPDVKRKYDIRSGNSKIWTWSCWNLWIQTRTSFR